MKLTYEIEEKITLQQIKRLNYSLTKRLVVYLTVLASILKIIFLSVRKKFKGQ